MLVLSAVYVVALLSCVVVVNKQAGRQTCKQIGTRIIMKRIQADEVLVEGKETETEREKDK